MPVTSQVESPPAIETTVAALNQTPYRRVRLGWPEPDDGWTRCADVDSDFLAGWEARLAAQLELRYGRSHPVTATGFVLDFYAQVPAGVGGAAFRLLRRVPRLDRTALAFQLDEEEQYPSTVALLEQRFWCLPSDPAAEQPSATVVADEATLAAVLRAQLRSHADEFLAGFRGAGIPRRNRLGAFFDALEAGIWFGADATAAAAPEVLSAARTVLPGGTREFIDSSTMYLLTDAIGRRHLSRRRLACCYYFKITSDGAACATCPRVDDAARTQRYAEYD